MKDAYKELLKKAAEWIENHRDEFLDELRRLIRIPSVSREEDAQPGAPFGPECLRVLNEIMDRGRYYGFESENHDGYAASVYMGDPVNSIGMIAHLDVVPVGEGWVYPPFDTTYLPEHEAVIGRGVCDNKGAAVMGLFAMRMLREMNWQLKHGIRLLCGSSEEIGMQDLQYMVDKGIPFPKLSLVPDAGFPANYAQKGSVDAELDIDCKGNLLRLDAGSVRNVIPDYAECTVAVDYADASKALKQLDEELKQKISMEACDGGVLITARGRSGHAAFPDGGVNAISLLVSALKKMAILEGSCANAINAVAELTQDAYGISEGVAYEDEASGKLTLVYGVVHLKEGVLTLSADSRYSVTLQKDDISRRMQEGWKRLGFQIAHFDATEPFYMPKTDKRVIALQELHKEVTGIDTEPYSMGGGTYSRIAPNAITYGPGLRGVQHDMSFLPEGHGHGHGRDEVMFVKDAFTAFSIYVVALAMLDEIVD